MLFPPKKTCYSQFLKYALNTDYCRATYAQSIHKDVNFQLIFNYLMSSWEMILSSGAKELKRKQRCEAENFNIYIKCLWPALSFGSNYHLVMLSGLSWWYYCWWYWCLSNSSYMSGIIVGVLHGPSHFILKTHLLHDPYFTEEIRWPQHDRIWTVWTGSQHA